MRLPGSTLQRHHHPRLVACLLACASLLATTTASALAQTAPEQPGTPGTWTEGVRCEKDPTQTYSLYLPSQFDPQQQWPALMIFDPRGRSRRSGNLFERAAETFGWVLVSSNDTRSDEAWDPNAKALQALWPEVHSRYSIDPHRIYGAGFSGGVIIAWYLAQLADPPTLAGILSAGGRPADEIPVESLHFAHFGTAGVFDFNYLPMKELDTMAANRNADHQLQFFRGRHQWMPEPLAYEGVEWMEVLAMRDGTRGRDTRFLDEVYGRYVQEADSLRNAGAALWALRRYELIRASWKDLRDLRAINKRIDRLSDSDAVQKQRRAEHELNLWEATKQQEFLPWLGALENGTNELDWQDLADELRLEDLRQKSEKRTPEGDAARRILEWTFARTSFYIHRQLLATGNPSQAAVSLRLAASIHPHLSFVWYNLACAHARAEEVDDGNEALRRAVDAGFDNLPHLTSDPDLANLRSTKDYRETVARLQ